MRRALLSAALAGGLALAAAPAVGGDPLFGAAPSLDPAEGLYAPLPFDHPQHAETFRAERITCLDCHPVGAAQPADEGTRAPDPPFPPPLESCHGCHLDGWRGAPRAAPSTCGSCHADLLSLTPSSHGPGWIERHAGDARAFGASCQDCHETRECFDCHQDRGPLSADPHPPGFSSTHGVSARVDPRSCASCHAETTCLQCHQGGVLP